MRSGRFVSTWNVCRFAAGITMNTRKIASSDRFSWNRSLMEFTKIRRGFRHRSGRSSIDSTSCTLPVQRGPCDVDFTSPLYGPPL